MAKRQPQIDAIFRALGDPTRRTIIERLSAGPLTISALAALLSITVTAVGQHIQILEKCGLSISEKEGRARTCRIDPVGFAKLDSWIASQRALWNTRLDRLGSLLADEDA